MRVLKKSFGRAVTLLLLLMFSAAIIPMDFYHDHTTEETVCADWTEKGTCQHKFHLSKKSKPCLACAVHYDQKYIASTFSESKISLSAAAVYSKTEVTGYYIRLIATALRGPPIG